MAHKDQTLDIRRALAPGTRLRNAIELILRQRPGHLSCWATGATSRRSVPAGSISTAPTSVRRGWLKLAKMDGAVITDGAAEVIYRANVHLIPDPSIATSETGTRHRTAERVAIQTGRAVVVVSQGRQNVTVFVGARQFGCAARPRCWHSPIRIC